MVESEKIRENKRNPKVSVIMPLFNHGKYVKEAIMSVLGQTVQNIELIVINDGSTDDSDDVVKSISDGRIRYFYQSNEGAPKTINKGIGLAQGEYISILNSDDLYYADRLENALEILEEFNTVSAVFSHIEFIDADGNFVRFKRGAEDNWQGHKREISFKENHNIILDLLAGNFIHTTSNLICRKSVFDHIGYFSDLRYVHDYDFFLRLCYHFKVSIIEKPLLKYRFHSSNTLDEDFALSIFETGLVLAKFLMENDLKKIFVDGGQGHATMAKFFNSVKTFDTEKIIMTLCLFGLKYCKGEDLIKSLMENPDNLFRTVCVAAIRENRDMSLLRQEVMWQKEQTELWWKKAEELKKKEEELKKKEEELKRELSWQKEQTELWWKKEEELKERAEELKNKVVYLNAEVKQRDEKVRKLSEKEVMLDEMMISHKWHFILKLNGFIDRILPIGSKRRHWFTNFVEKRRHDKA